MKTLPSSEQLDTIILDFGGVLYNIDYSAPARAFKALGMENFEELYSKASQTDLFDKLETGSISNDHFLTELQKFVPENSSKEQVLEAWNSILIGIPKRRIAFVHQLNERYRMFLLSNTNALHVEQFEQDIDAEMGLDYFRSAFEKVHYSNVLGIKKPYPETYLQVCKMHDLDPQRTLFVDDSPQHVKGAIEAGLFGYHLEVPKEDITSALSSLLS